MILRAGVPPERRKAECCRDRYDLRCAAYYSFGARGPDGPRSAGARGRCRARGRLVRHDRRGDALFRLRHSVHAGARRRRGEGLRRVQGPQHPGVLCLRVERALPRRLRACLAADQASRLRGLLCGFCLRAGGRCLTDSRGRREDVGRCVRPSHDRDTARTGHGRVAGLEPRGPCGRGGVRRLAGPGRCADHTGRDGLRGLRQRPSRVRDRGGHDQHRVLLAKDGTDRGRRGDGRPLPGGGHRDGPGAVAVRSFGADPRLVRAGPTSSDGGAR